MELYTKNDKNPLHALLNNVLEGRRKINTTAGTGSVTVNVKPAVQNDEESKRLMDTRIIVINTARDNVVIMNGFSNVISMHNIDETAFKGIADVVPMFEDDANVGIIDCKAISDEILDHFQHWYGDVNNVDDAFELLSEMMIYALRNYTMQMAVNICGEEIIANIRGQLSERIEAAKKHGTSEDTN